MRSIHIIEYYLTITKNKVLIHVTEQINLENIMLGERNQSQRPHTVMIPYV